MPLGVITGICRDGDPNDTGDYQPYVRARLNTGVEVRAFYGGEPPPPLSVCSFATDGTTYWCEGPYGLEVRTVEHEDFLTMPGFASETQTYTPVLAQGTNQAITSTTKYAYYVRHGSFVGVWASVQANAAGQTANVITCTLPVVADSTLAASTNRHTLGVGYYNDASSNTFEGAQVQLYGTTNVALYQTRVAITGNVGSVPAFAANTNDIFHFSCWYLAG